MRSGFPEREKNVTASELGHRVREARRAQGLRQADLAAAAGVGTRFLVDLERGKPTAHLGKMLQVIDALGLQLMLSPRSAL